MQPAGAPDPHAPPPSAPGAGEASKRDVVAVAGLTRHAPLLGISLKLASTLVFSVMVVALKVTAETVPVGEIVFARNFFGMWPVLIMVALRGELMQAFRTRNVMGHLGRSLVGVTAMVFSFTAFALLPLPDATAIGFATPLLVVVLAWAVLGEVVRVYRWSAVIVGFLGIVIILSPHLGRGDFTGAEALGAVCAAMSALFAAMAMIFVRKLCESERTSTIVTWFSGSATVLALLTIPAGWIWPSQAWILPDGTTGLLLVLVGLSGGVGQILLTQSYRYADASTIAPFDYLNMLWAILFGWFLFAEVPVAEVVIGALVVIAAGIFVIYREHRLGLDRTRNRRASTPSKA
ncbi:DMT family transporter [Roseibium aestuarii]|uniref:DMT family transporter n=1 Tax=Roseibium aestuarii TaxID=2600299 RepID=A0ABW4K0T7_9HYPH|nr:DMT family transporter [Roseibium aestuarii]